ncbi:hypothetical protein U1Q18_011138 [Sarracenia purpurea var. burkii]
MARTSLPPGFRFHPTDVELVKYYLKKKVMGKRLKFEAISELNIYKYSPWDLPDKSILRSKDLEWYFFCPKERKYSSGARMNRATEIGYWKSTGKDRSVSYKEQTVGMVKTLVFHIGHAPKGERTDWVMHEYRIEDKELADAGVVQDAFVLCKIFQKSGPGPKNGAQYGAPFNEEEWDDDAEICAESLPSAGVPQLPLPCDGSVFVPETTVCGPLCPSMSKTMPLADEVLPPDPDNNEDIVSMLDMFREDSSLLPYQDGNNKEDNFSCVKNNEGFACDDGDGSDIYNDLRDLDNGAEWIGGRFNLSSHRTIGYGLNPMLELNDAEFVELNDLNDPLSVPPIERASDYAFIDGLWESDNYNASLGRNYWPGEPQRNSYSRLQQLLESIIIFANYGSSAPAKAEVTCRFSACTNEALSAMLEESPNLPNYPELVKKLNAGTGFGLFFSLVMISSLRWIILIVLFTKLGRYLWDFVILEHMGTVLVCYNCRVQFCELCERN